MSIEGKITLVTGANSGLGKATTVGLAQMGAHVVMVCRDQVRGEAARQEIIERSGNTHVDLLMADLSSQQSIRQLVNTFRAKHAHLHLLINNAGAVFMRRTLSADAIEMSLAVNHLAPFLLTNLLLDTLKSSAPARIINVGTRIGTSLNLEDLQFEQRPYRGLQAYAQTKLGNILFTYSLAQRLVETGVTVNCVHPGVFKSNLGSNNTDEPFLLKIAGWLGKFILPDADHAAQRILYLAVSPEVATITGQYFGNRKPLQSPSQTYDITTQEQLWEISTALTLVNTSNTMGGSTTTN
ncbi:MAG: SDR family oxidoreductase [Chloroflexi bacterium]|nr:SDR family oxidoreductase [Chloroflexota bacterium]